MLNRIAATAKDKTKVVRINYATASRLLSKKYAFMSMGERTYVSVSTKLDRLKGKDNIILIDDIGSYLDKERFESILSKLKRLHAEGRIAKGIITLMTKDDFKVIGL